MTKTTKIIISILLGLATLGCYAYVFWYNCTQMYDVNMSIPHEYLCMLLTGATGVFCFNAFAYKIKSRVAKIFIAIGVSILPSVIIVFAKAFWRYMNFNNFFKWDRPVPYNVFLLDHLEFIQKHFWQVHLLFILALFVFCSLTAFKNTNKIQDGIDLKTFLQNFKKQDDDEEFLEETYLEEQYLNSEDE